jgi:hypothetical protein
MLPLSSIILCNLLTSSSYMAIPPDMSAVILSHTAC